MRLSTIDKAYYQPCILPSFSDGIQNVSQTFGHLFKLYDLPPNYLVEAALEPSPAVCQGSADKETRLCAVQVFVPNRHLLKAYIWPIMSAAVTFGSVGDIISLCLLVKDVVKALDDSRGSSSEYQEVIRELWALERVLLEVELFWRTCEITVELNTLRETTCRTVDQCRRCIEGFLKKVEKYGPSLREGGSGGIIRDVGKKLHWQVSHSQDLTKFRAEINAHCSAISMLLMTTSM